MLINACKYYQIPNHTDKHKGILMNKLKKNSPTYSSISNLNYLALTKNYVHTYSRTILFRHPNSMASLNYINTVPPLQPIVSHCNSQLHPTARLLDHCLQPLAKVHPDYIQNATELSLILQDLQVSDDAFLVSIDVDSLYPSIPQSASM